MNSFTGRLANAVHRVSRAAVAAGVFLLCLAGPAAALAQSNAIEAVSSVQQGGTTYVRITLKSPPAAVPAGFSVADPPRIALDFPDTANKSGSSLVELAQGDARSAAIVQSGQRSRIVLNLKRPLNYSASLEGNTVVVAL
ncbi:MAG: AMIN domain-containing protein, partial [Gammaproteobacteria bacterium]